MLKTDNELLRACRKGEVRAWETLMDKYERLVFSIPLNYGLSREDAADVSQLTFTIFMQSMDSLRDDSRLGAWLATVARRHSWRLMEKNRREGTSGKEDLASSDLAGSGLADDSGGGGAEILFGGGDESPERWETVQWLDQGLAQVGAKCRELLSILYFDEEFPSYIDAAERLDMPIGSIGPTRARCLKRLKEALENLE